MKKGLVFLILVLMFSGLVISENDAGLTGGLDDAEKINDALDKYSPISVEGEVNDELVGQTISKAEMRILAINEWLNTHASWLNVVFGMVPEISWLFLVNIYIWIFALTWWVINGKFPADLASFSQKKAEIGFIETKWANVIGFFFFVISLFSKLFVFIAQAILDFAGYLWNVVLPYSILAAIVVMIIIAVLLFFLPGVVLGIFEGLVEWFAKRKARQRMEESMEDQEVFHELVKNVTDDN